MTLLSFPNSLPTIEIRNFSAWFGHRLILRQIDLKAYAQAVTAIIGPSGCGKSTLIRCINRLHEESAGATVQGEILLKGENIYHPKMDPVLVRRQVGMVFQRPNPFPAFSIFDNVAAGLKFAGIRKKSLLNEIVEKSLRDAVLWDEVKDHLRSPGLSLSGGQQQRLCIARALAVEPKVLLMDEPTSALDPVSTTKIEELLSELKKRVTIILVTHNMQQAARVSDRTAFILSGELVEFGETSRIFTNPRKKQTESYITGRFGS